MDISLGVNLVGERRGGSAGWINDGDVNAFNNRRSRSSRRGGVVWSV